jgi:metal-sulfur cluster biosynthetic enzyme
MESEVASTRPPEAGDAPSTSLGAEAPEAPETEASAEASGVLAEAENGEPTKEQVLDALKAVFDPELGINIVDLGLVYKVGIEDGTVGIEYSLTTMGCPIGPLIEAQMTDVLTKIPGVETVTPEMVLRPPWSPEMMSEEAKAALGYF